MSNTRYQLNKNKYLLDHEYDRLIQILDSYIHKNPRDCLLIYLCLLTGARASEVLNITYNDINLYDESIFIHGLKNSNDREIPIKDKIFKKLINYLEISKNNIPTGEKLQERIFPISYIRFHQIWDHYRPTHKKLHCLRHTFAIRLYKKTKDIRLLQFALGHRNIANTMIYADYVYSQEELKKLIL
jgi:integrase/recombinase XerC